MNTRLKTFLFIVCGLVFLFLLRRMKKNRAEIRYLLPWVALDAAVAVVTAFPGILDWFCGLFGIETPSNMLFFFALLFLAAIVCSLTLTASKQSAQIRDLAQRLALRENREAADGKENEKETGNAT